MAIAKVFWNGRSQAVRLPKEFRVSGDSVRVRRHGNAIILEPIAEGWDWLDALTGDVDADFAAAASEQPEQQARGALDELFDP